MSLLRAIIYTEATQASGVGVGLGGAFCNQPHVQGNIPPSQNLIMLYLGKGTAFSHIDL